MYKLITSTLVLESVAVASLMTYANYMKLDELERYFIKNEAVQQNKRYWPGKMPYDKMMRMVLISNLLTMPRRYIRDGEITEEEYNSIPRSLKRWATWPGYLGLQLVVCAGLWYFLKP
ncbi:hypothetical protein [Pseudomonas sp. PAMC 26793]|uniref:hypothetical protein n=1 Tax=Pseudomonas TaxID=286 RepID=UPI000365A4EA|nr:hypothetical protein [Pseudomonas sp. PAMC 26793]